MHFKHYAKSSWRGVQKSHWREGHVGGTLQDWIAFRHRSWQSSGTVDNHDVGLIGPKMWETVRLGSLAAQEVLHQRPSDRLRDVLSKLSSNLKLGRRADRTVS